MRIEGAISFWDDGVACFCHENVARALHKAFGDVTIDVTDLAYEKYSRVADIPALERSAWFEFLRNGPRHRFRLGSGVTGILSRYRIEFDIPDGLVETESPHVRQFLKALKLGPIVIEEKE